MRRSLRQDDKPIEEPSPLPESEFSFTLTRVAVAQICQSMGFSGAQNSALEALTDVATRYLQAIAKLAAASANSDGRTQSNLPDIIVALEDLASVQGFPGFSSTRSVSLYSSPVIKNLMKFVNYTDEIPFARPLPPRKKNFQGAKGKLLKYKGDWDNSRRYYLDGDGWRHVPRWLPAVPVVERKENGAEMKQEVKWGCLDGRGEREDENNINGQQTYPYIHECLQSKLENKKIFYKSVHKKITLDLAIRKNR
ncbi:hypothetical protein DH2020_035418 [Rehmannia glutinosa]|uniref:Bromodomain associated domain-containing protein n=1 Tax=Rehmannia glutinosa TaxID=99300 RepID=A0ABR0V781_REHGL